MKKISASFLSCKDVVLGLKKLNETDVDFIHVDIMDGKFVKNKTMPFREMRNIYKYTSKRVKKRVKKRVRSVLKTEDKTKLLGNEIVYLKTKM